MFGRSGGLDNKAKICTLLLQPHIPPPLEPNSSHPPLITWTSALLQSVSKATTNSTVSYKLLHNTLRGHPCIIHTSFMHHPKLKKGMDTTGFFEDFIRRCYVMTI